MVVSWMFPFQVSEQSHPAQHDSRSAELVDSALDAAGIFHTEAVSTIYTGGPDSHRDLTHHLNYSVERLAQVGTGQPSEVDILLLRDALDSLQNAGPRHRSNSRTRRATASVRNQLLRVSGGDLSPHAHESALRNLRRTFQTAAKPGFPLEARLAVGLPCQSAGLAGAA